MTNRGACSWAYAYRRTHRLCARSQPDRSQTTRSNDQKWRSIVAVQLGHSNVVLNHLLNYNITGSSCGVAVGSTTACVPHVYNVR